jgi:uncharacterized protein (TIGR03000 family)
MPKEGQIVPQARLMRPLAGRAVRRSLREASPPPAPPTAPGLVLVSSPVDARVKLDNTISLSNAPVRKFGIPSLRQGKKYEYTVKGEVVRNGRTLTATKMITIEAGQEIRVDLDFSEASLVQR